MMVRLNPLRFVLMLAIVVETLIILVLLSGRDFRIEEAKCPSGRRRNKKDLPILYIITPTYYRNTQKADMTRLSQTLRNVDNVHWIVVEDANSTSERVHSILERSGLPYTHLAAATPEEYRERKLMGRGVFNRRRGLQWLREEADDGVLYFADDDNTYDLRIFEQIRYTKRVSVFPVGMILSLGISSPIVRHDKVIGFHDAFQAGRKFALDMAGFAVNLRLLHSNPKADIPLQVSYLENGFLKALDIELEDLEPVADKCTQVLVWHTRTQRPATPDIKAVSKEYLDTNLILLYKHELA
ncbi:galactosylgalactosylxylosylprotein 3-beta-glucuronosyltransferase P-like [Oratosquilla oratoria]|uniref:galactosylgalactosylxylosylprotein 3-beta-glucuronosyltransferase P-like n=1 Tax=Oratosquilla oratoria TaxID=337810 RepID=UPI003F75F38F